MTVRQIIKKEKSSDENSCYLLKFKKYVKINGEKFDSWRPKLVIETELLAYKDSYYTFYEFGQEYKVNFSSMCHSKFEMSNDFSIFTDSVTYF